MKKGELSETFKTSTAVQRAAFIYSANAAVQLEQHQLADAGTAPGHLEAIFDDEFQREKQKQDDAFFEYAAMVLDDIQRRALEATQAARKALTRFEDTLERSRKAFAAREAEPPAHTIVLTDGRAVYYDEAAASFAYQNESGAWHELTDPEALAEAQERAKANGGLAATKSTKQALDAWQTDLATGAELHADQHHRFEEIRDRAAREDITPDDQAEAMEQIKDDLDDFAAQLKGHEISVRRNIAPAAVAVERRAGTAKRDELSESTASQKSSTEIRAAFSATPAQEDEGRRVNHTPPSGPAV